MLDNSIKEFCDILKIHTEKKRKLYDGFNNSIEGKIDTKQAIILCAEELGEIASAVTRNRLGLAKSECIDLAHCAFLLYCILRKHNN